MCNVEAVADDDRDAPSADTDTESDDSELSDVEDKGYVKEKPKLRLTLARTEKPSIKCLYYNTAKVSNTFNRLALASLYF